MQQPLSSHDEERLSLRLIHQLAREEEWDSALLMAGQQNPALLQQAHGIHNDHFDDNDTDEDYAPAASSKKRKVAARKPRTPKESKPPRSRKSGANAPQTTGIPGPAAESGMNSSVEDQSSSLNTMQTSFPIPIATAPQPGIGLPFTPDFSHPDPSTDGASIPFLHPPPAVVLGTETVSTSIVTQSMEISGDAASAPTTKKARKSRSSTGGPGQPEEENPNHKRGTFTAEEEVLFLQGLESFGRDWKKLSDHMGTRSVESIKSHAQKHFIKLFRDKVPLPAKVQETGDGYTLSGKPLDPRSAAAKPYLRHLYPPEEEESKLEGDSLTASLGNHDGGEKVMPTEATGSNLSNALEKPTKKPRKSRESVGKKRKRDANVDASAENETSAIAAGGGDLSQSVADIPLNEPITPSKDRRMDSEDQKLDEEDGPPLRMQLRTRAPGRSLTGMEESSLEAKDPFALVTPGYYAVNQQPFSIRIPLEAVLTMEIAAHLSSTEVVGFLEGVYDSESKVLSIIRAHPCRPASTGPTEVEADAVHELQIRERIRQEGKGHTSVVGWYHSHPVFATHPSNLDIETQCTFQKAARDTPETEDVPYIGVIISPYDPREISPVSKISVFVVEGGNARKACDISSDECGSIDRESKAPEMAASETTKVPMRMDWEICLENGNKTIDAERIWGELFHDHRQSPRIDLNEMWNPAVVQTRSNKLWSSYVSRMEEIAKSHQTAPSDLEKRFAFGKTLQHGLLLPSEE